MDNNNPIKKFFSPNNVLSLYQTIQQGLQERYQTTIPERYVEQLIDIMKMVVEPLPQRIPANVDRDWFIQSLNKQVLKEAVPMFADIASKHADQQLGYAADSTQQAPLLPPQRKPQQDPMRPQSTPINKVLNVEVDEAKLSKLMQERGNKAAPVPRPKFEDDEPEYPDDINDLYELEEQSRHHQDVIPPPTEAIGETRSTPILYTQPPVVPVAVSPLQSAYNPNEFIGAPPRGAERITSSSNSTVIRRFDEPSIGDLLGNEVEDEETPPQPAELRLIPQTSRNQVSTSKAIPNVLIVNSADRNQNIYPNASDFRVQLLRQYTDVESLELSCALIPLSAYNVNSTNNKINFEETMGTTLTAVIPVGNYPDATTLAFAVAASLTAATANGVTYSAAVDPLTGKFTITSDGAGGSIFTLIFFGTPSLEGVGPVQYQRERPSYPPDSSGSILGFAPTDYSGSLTYTAPFTPNLDGEPAVYVHVQEAEMLDSNNPRVQDALACIAIAGGNEGRGYERFAASEWCRFVRYYSPLEGKIGTLTISLRTASGSLLDLNGRDYVLTFNIVTNDKTQSVYGED